MDPEYHFSLPFNNIHMLHILITPLTDSLTFASEMLSSGTIKTFLGVQPVGD